MLDISKEAVEFGHTRIFGVEIRIVRHEELAVHTVTDSPLQIPIVVGGIGGNRIHWIICSSHELWVVFGHRRVSDASMHHDKRTPRRRVFFDISSLLT